MLHSAHKRRLMGGLWSIAEKDTVLIYGCTLMSVRVLHVPIHRFYAEGVRPGLIKQMGKGRGGARGGRDGEGQGKGRLLPCRLDLRSLYESEHM